MIGMDVPIPERACADSNCPFHAGLPVRGKIFEGTVTGTRAKKTITIQRESPVYISKFKRYARSKSTVHAHAPECLDIEEGNRVLAAECRPLAKSVSFVVVEVRR